MIETIHLQLLLATFAGWVGRQQSAVIAYLIEENRVLKEQLERGGRRLRFTDDQRRRLADHPEVEEAWLDYLIEEWEPWSQEMRQWQEVQFVYESLDFMRRRLEEAEERYELVLAIGFLQYHDPTGTAVARHVLTAPAELTLDAARGLLNVAPAASFDAFQVELLDMLESEAGACTSKAR